MSFSDNFDLNPNYDLFEMNPLYSTPRHECSHSLSELYHDISDQATHAARVVGAIGSSLTTAYLASKPQTPPYSCSGDDESSEGDLVNLDAHFDDEVDLRFCESPITEWNEDTTIVHEDVNLGLSQLRVDTSYTPSYSPFREFNSPMFEKQLASFVTPVKSIRKRNKRLQRESRKYACKLHAISQSLKEVNAAVIELCKVLVQEEI